MIITNGVQVTSTKSVEELHAWAKQAGIPRGCFKQRLGCATYFLPEKRRMYGTMPTGVQERGTHEVVMFGRQIFKEAAG